MAALKINDEPQASREPENVPAGDDAPLPDELGESFLFWIPLLSVVYCLDQITFKVYVWHAAFVHSAYCQVAWGSLD